MSNDAKICERRRLKRKAENRNQKKDSKKKISTKKKLCTQDEEDVGHVACV
jgi:hypothetical protein